GEGRQGAECRNPPAAKPPALSLWVTGEGVWGPAGAATRRYTSLGPPSRCAGRPARSAPVVRHGGHGPLTPARRDWPPSFGAALSGSAGRTDERLPGPAPAVAACLPLRPVGRRTRPTPAPRPRLRRRRLLEPPLRGTPHPADTRTPAPPSPSPPA